MPVVLAMVALFGTSALAGGGAPTVETERPGPANIGRTTLTLQGSVNPNGTNVTECYFEYGTSETALENTASCTYLPGESETPIPVTATATGLNETTTYYYRLHAVSAEGASSGLIHASETLPNPPNTNTEPANPIGRTSATLQGFVNPDGSPVTECDFEWGTTPELGNTVECDSSPGEGSLPVPVHASISGLSESSTYYFRVIARNGFGQTHGSKSNFETLPSSPTPNTEDAVSVTHTSAVLTGWVNPNGSNVETCYFEWGVGVSEGNVTPCEQTEIGSGETRVKVTAQLAGLAESTSYRFKLVAGNAHGTNHAGTYQFATLPNEAKLLIGRPRELADESALMVAKVDPQDEAITECTFEYGTTPALGKKSTCNTLPPAGEHYTQVTGAATGLTPVTTYIYRVRVANASGVNYSREETFTTFEAGLLPILTKLKPKKGSSAGGNEVTIGGQNLLNTTAVSFGEFETTDVVSDTADSVTVVAPAGVGTVDVVVRTGNGESQIVAADQYTYGKPIVTSVSPGNGAIAGGTPVTVTGNGFELGTTGTTFLFNKVPATAVECTASTSCTMVTPPEAKGKAATVKIQAVVNGKKSSASPGGLFHYE